MLLLCTKDLYTNNFQKKIFSVGEVYKAYFGKYKDTLNESELEAFQAIEKEHPLISQFLQWNVIVINNDHGERWLIHMFENTEDYDMKNPFKNENFAQISTFYDG